MELTRTKVCDIVRKAVNLMIQQPDDELGRESRNQDLTVFIDRGYLALAKHQDKSKRTNIIQILQDLNVSFLGNTLYNAFRIYQLACLETFTPNAISFESWQRARKNTTSFEVFLEELHKGMRYQFHGHNQSPLSVSSNVNAVNPESSITSSPQNEDSEEQTKYVKTIILDLIQGLKKSSQKEHTLSRNQTYGTPPCRRTCIVCCVRCEKSQAHTTRRRKSTTKECKGCKISPGQFAAFCKGCFDTFHKLGAESLSDVHFSFVNELERRSQKSNS